MNMNSLYPHPDDANPKEKVFKSKIHEHQANHRQLWRLSGILMVILAISFGVGLGVGLPASRVSSPSTAGTPSPPQRIHGVLNDTSLAVSMTPDNNRHLFFQDVNGSLRHTVFSQSLGAWSSSIDFIQTPQQPKLHTPLSVVAASMKNFKQASFILSFASINDSLVVFGYNVSPTGQLYFPQNLFNTSYPMLPSSRSLSSVPLQSYKDQISTNSTYENKTLLLEDLLLFYPSPSNEVTVMHGSRILPPDQNNESVVDCWIWRNVTEFFIPVTYSNSLLPFTVTEVNGDFSSWLLEVNYGPDAAPSSYLLGVSWTNISSSGKESFHLHLLLLKRRV